MFKYTLPAGLVILIVCDTQLLKKTTPTIWVKASGRGQTWREFSHHLSQTRQLFVKSTDSWMRRLIAFIHDSWRELPVVTCLTCWCQGVTSMLAVPWKSFRENWVDWCTFKWLYVFRNGLSWPIVPTHFSSTYSRPCHCPWWGDRDPL